MIIKKDNNYNLLNNDKKIFNKYFKKDLDILNFSLENKYYEAKESDELLNPISSDDILNCKKYLTNNLKKDSLINLNENSNVILKNNKIIYLNNNNENKKFNIEEISTIKFQQQSLSNDTESQILFKAKANQNRTEKNTINNNFSYRNNLAKNKYQIENNIYYKTCPQSAKNKNNKYVNVIETFNFIINDILFKTENINNKQNKIMNQFPNENDSKKEIINNNNDLDIKERKKRENKINGIKNKRILENKKTKTNNIYNLKDNEEIINKDNVNINKIKNENFEIIEKRKRKL